MKVPDAAIADEHVRAIVLRVDIENRQLMRGGRA